MGLRVVAVLQGLSEGGAVASCCLNQLIALATEHHCRLISDGLPAAALPQALSLECLRVPRLRWLRRYAHVPRQILFIAMAGVTLCVQRPRRHVDLVLFHSHPPTALLAPLLRRVLGCRVVMVMHGDIFDRPRGTYDPRLTWWYRVCTSAAYRRADAVLALSPYMASLAVQRGARPERLHLVPNGVDAEEIGLQHPWPLPQGQELLFVGRLEHNKGLDLLL
ncbi:MAG: glycosyltransferase, partial [Cyanobium sp.]